MLTREIKTENREGFSTPFYNTLSAPRCLPSIHQSYFPLLRPLIMSAHIDYGSSPAANAKAHVEAPPRLDNVHFPVLEADGSNYLEWAINAQDNLVAREVSDAVNFNGTMDSAHAAETATAPTEAKALILIRHHLERALQH